MGTRIKVPAERVRTAEQILEGATIIKGHVWVACYNCGGSGTYPSSCTPPGMCRLYCWAKPYTDPIAQAMGQSPPAKSLDDPTYGKRPTPVEKYVKRAQAADRAAYRRELQWELDRPAREAAEREAAARKVLEDAHADALAEDEHRRKQVSQWVGTLGERLEIEGTVERVGKFERSHYVYRGQTETVHVTTLRTDGGDVIVWYGESATVGERLRVRGTIKDHKVYRDEKQTQLNRVKLFEAAAQQ